METLITIAENMWTAKQLQDNWMAFNDDKIENFGEGKYTEPPSNSFYNERPIYTYVQR